MIAISLIAYFVVEHIWKNSKIKGVLLSISSASFTIYLFHQFVINAIVIETWYFDNYIYTILELALCGLLIPTILEFAINQIKVQIK